MTPRERAEQVYDRTLALLKAAQLTLDGREVPHETVLRERKRRRRARGPRL